MTKKTRIHRTAIQNNSFIVLSVYGVSERNQPLWGGLGILGGTKTLIVRK